MLLSLNSQVKEYETMERPLSSVASTAQRGMILILLKLLSAAYNYGFACPPPPPTAPTNLTATSISSFEIDLSWTDSLGEDGYTIQRSPNGTGDWGFAGAVNANITTFHDTNSLNEGRQYYYRVYAHNNGGNSEYSNVANTLTRPATPSNLVSIARTSHRIDLSWHDNSTSESGYRVYIAFPGNSFYLLATLPANTQFYAVKQLDPVTDYNFKVTAYNSVGESINPEIASDMTLGTASFSETWDQIAGPVYPFASYNPNSYGIVTYADNSWGWYTDDAVTSCSFRTLYSSYELGRFAAGSSNGEFLLRSSLPQFNFNDEPNQSLELGFEVKIDNIGEEDNRKMRIELRNETNYGGGSAIVLEVNGNVNSPALSMHSENFGTVSNSLDAESSFEDYGEANTYWVYVSFIQDESGIDTHYDLYNKEDLYNPVNSGDGVLDTMPILNLDQMRLGFEQNFVGSIDDIEIVTSTGGEFRTLYSQSDQFQTLEEYEEQPIPVGFYRNPLRIRNGADQPIISLEDTTDYLADPYVIKYMGKYYLYSSGCKPSIPLPVQQIRVWESDNLTSWTLLRSVINTADGPEGWGGTVAMSPSIFYDNGNFYMNVSYYRTNPYSGKVEEKLKLFSAKFPYDTFSTTASTTILPQTIGGHWFMDDDGQPYFFYSAKRDSGIRYQHMSSLLDPDGTTVSLANTRVNADGYDAYSHHWKYVEGPKVLKIKGRYYLSFIGNTYWYPEYQTWSLSSNSLEGLTTATATSFFHQSDTTYIAKNSNDDPYDGHNYTGPACTAMVLGPDLRTFYSISSVLFDYPLRINGSLNPLDPMKVLVLDKIMANVDRLVVIDNMWPTVGPTLNPQPLPQMPDWSDKMDRSYIGDWNNNGGTWTMQTYTYGHTWYYMRGEAIGLNGLKQQTSNHFAEGFSTHEFNIRLEQIGENEIPIRYGCVIGYDSSTSNGLSVLIDPTSKTLEVKEFYSGETYQLAQESIPRAFTWNPYTWHTMRIDRLGSKISVYLDDLNLAECDALNKTGGHPGFIIQNCDADFSYTAFTNRTDENGMKTWKSYR